MVGIYQFADRQSKCKPKPDAPPPKLATAELWLRAHRISFAHCSQDRVWTTLEAFGAFDLHHLGLTP